MLLVLWVWKRWRRLKNYLTSYSLDKIEKMRPNVLHRFFLLHALCFFIEFYSPNSKFHSRHSQSLHSIDEQYRYSMYMQSPFTRCWHSTGRMLAHTTKHRLTSLNMKMPRIHKPHIVAPCRRCFLLQWLHPSQQVTINLLNWGITRELLPHCTGQVQRCGMLFDNDTVYGKSWWCYSEQQWLQPWRKH